MFKILEVIFIILVNFISIYKYNKKTGICHLKYDVLGKLINTSKRLQTYKILIDLVNYKNNSFLLKSLSLINSTSPFTFPKYLVECL